SCPMMSATGTMTKTSLSLESVVRSTLSRTQWPTPQDHTGTPRGKAGKAGMQYWDLRDPDQEPFPSILQNVKAILDDYGKRVPGGDFIEFNIYMVGKAAEASAPHIMVACQTVRIRKEIEALIKKNGILRSHPGLYVGSWSSVPDHRNVVQTGGA